MEKGVCGERPSLQRPITGLVIHDTRHGSWARILPSSSCLSPAREVTRHVY